jgi:hypothetical protein
MSAIDDLFSDFANEPIPGGCDKCEAYQTMKADVVHEGIYYLAVHHDDGCPFLRAKAAGSN